MTTRKKITDEEWCACSEKELEEIILYILNGVKDKVCSPVALACILYRAEEEFLTNWHARMIDVQFSASVNGPVLRRLNGIKESPWESVCYNGVNMIPLRKPDMERLTENICMVLNMVLEEYDFYMATGSIREYINDRKDYAWKKALKTKGKMINPVTRYRSIVDKNHSDKKDVEEFKKCVKENLTKRKNAGYEIY